MEPREGWRGPKEGRSRRVRGRGSRDQGMWGRGGEGRGVSLVKGRDDSRGGTRKEEGTERERKPHQGEKWN